MTGGFWGAVGVATLVALIVPFVLRPILARAGAFDVPNHRSSHSRPTLRGGGIAPWLGLAAGGTLAVLSASTDRSVLAAVLLSAIAMGLVGLVEDLRGLRVMMRAGLQFLVGGAVAAVLLHISAGSWLWVPLAALFFAANVNFTNFMDGINGISGLHGLVTGLSFAAFGYAAGLPWLAAIGLLIAGTYSAFLPWNFVPPGMFLGDVGSYLLGGVAAAAAIAAIAFGVPPVAALAPLAIYWADTIFTLIRRVAGGERVFEAHRTHTYQRLTSAGLSHVSVSILVGTFALGASALGLVALLRPSSTVLSAFGIVALCTVYVTLPWILGIISPKRARSDLADLQVPVFAPKGDAWHPTRWAVLGGTGFIGSAMARYLRDSGADVLVLPAPRLELSPAHVDGAEVADLASSLHEVDELSDQLAGVDVVVNAAGLATPDAPESAALYGANALVPAVVVIAAARAGVGRVVHLSSAAVQGDRPVLDESLEVQPFSPYSRSKALGERAALAAASFGSGDSDLVVLRATSVQGPGRATTETLRRVARSPLASVAAPGNYPTVVSTVDGLVRFVRYLGCLRDNVPVIALQPWEVLTVSKVLELAGGRPPRQLPAGFCRALVRLGKSLGRVVPRIAGPVRRVELMWFGQQQCRGNFPTVGSQGTDGGSWTSHDWA
ncbi:MAG TPA: NAD-dependent epimerase/dehydratase family protein [Arachnia sp.]|nr:NAD-dependent epimerase/dehydratase family protein [Arachnia sp.]HMT85151.1 NAD-dependent epimerase/dehydratase family protein [Arachnia sp.]